MIGRRLLAVSLVLVILTAQVDAKSCVLQAKGTVCRPSTGPCDPEELCTGVFLAPCPADIIATSGTICRNSTGPCDPAETCDGNAVTCPADLKAPMGTVCDTTSRKLPCNLGAVCDGADSACPAPLILPKCNPCPQGQYHPNATTQSASNCQLCPGGTFGNETGVISELACFACPPGSFSINGSAKCTLCPAGTHQHEASSPSCLPCADGTATSIIGLKDDCDYCRAGYYMATDRKSCQPCPSGTWCRYTAVPSISYCATCQDQQYGGKSGASDPSNCAPCPAGTFPNDDTRTCGSVLLTTAVPTAQPKTPAPIAKTTAVPTAQPKTPAPIAKTTAVPTAQPKTPAPIAKTTAVPTAQPKTPAPIAKTTAVPTATGVPKPVNATSAPSAAPTSKPTVVPPTTLPPACTVESSGVCRPPSGPCDNGGVCKGYSQNCPKSTLKANGTVCRKSAGLCDIVETCNGTSSSCPVDAWMPSTVVCRNSTGPCDPQETCSGSAGSCPADILLANTSVCRNASGVCDAQEYCTGTSGLCPPDLRFSNTTVCHASAGLCDPPEMCDGVNATCPPNGFLVAGAVCRPAVGMCDIAELCSGTSAVCPKDTIEKSTKVCRRSSDLCDAPEYCTGKAASCPDDLYLPNGTVCRMAVGACDVPEQCSGTSSDCPMDDVVQSGDICRPSSQMCDPPEMCDGIQTMCPSDVSSPCPWAWIPQPTRTLSDGHYCGTLTDNSIITVDLSESMLDVFVEAPAAAGTYTTPYVRFSAFIDETFYDLALQVNDFIFEIDGWSMSQGLLNTTKLLDYGNDTIVMDLTLVRASFVTKNQVVNLSKSSCERREFATGVFCGSAGSQEDLCSIVLEVMPKANDSADIQLAVLHLAQHNTPPGIPVREEIPLRFIDYLPQSEAVVFTSSNDGIRHVYSIFYNQQLQNYTVLPIVAQVTQSDFSLGFSGFVPLSTCAIAPAGYYCSLTLNMCIRVFRHAVYIDALDPDGQALVCDNVRATVTNSLLWTVEVPSCLQSLGVSSILYLFSSGAFSVKLLYYGTQKAFPLDKSFCGSSPTLAQWYCGRAGSTLFAWRSVASSVQVYSNGPDSSGSFRTCLIPRTKTNCAKVVRDGFCPDMPFYRATFTPSAVSIFEWQPTIAAIDAEAPLAIFFSSQCKIPSSTISYVGGLGLDGVPYYGAVTVSAPLSGQRLSNIVMTISNSSSVMCTMAGTGTLVLGATILWSSPSSPMGRCDSSPMVINSDVRADGVNVYLWVPNYISPLNKYVSAVPTGYNSAAYTYSLPQGRYCGDLGSGDFVIIQENENGTTTIFSSVDGVLAQTTLWKALANSGQSAGFIPIVNRSSDANGTLPCPVMLQGFLSSIGYQIQLRSKTYGNKMFRATPEKCFIQGLYCGISWAGSAGSEADISNSTYAVLSLSFDSAANQYTTAITVTRRVATETVMQLTFSDHPWLLAFSSAVRLSTAGTLYFPLWIISTSDGSGINITTSYCSKTVLRDLTNDTYCIAPTIDGQNQSAVQVTVDIARLEDGSVGSLSVYVLNDTDKSARNISISTFYQVRSLDGSFFLYTTPQEWYTTIGNITSDGTAISLSGGGLEGELGLSCVTLQNPLDDYCGTSGSSTVILVANMTLSIQGERSFTIATSQGTTTVYWVPAILATGEFILTRSVGPVSVSSIRYNISSDKISIGGIQKSLLIVSRDKCAKIADGDYCGYEDTINKLAYKISIVNSTVFARIPNRTEFLKCTGPFIRMTCFASTLRQRYMFDGDERIFNKNIEEIDYNSDGGTASFSPNGDRKIKGSFSLLNGATLLLLSQRACLTLPELLRTFNRTAVMHSANFSQNTRIAANDNGTVFVADVERHCVFTVDQVTGFVELLAGNCDTPGFMDGHAADALFNNITGILLDGVGRLLVLDAGNSRIRAILRSGDVTTISGNGSAASIDGIKGQTAFFQLAGASLHPKSGRPYISEAYRIRILNLADFTVKTYVGGSTAGYVNGSGTKALINRPGKLAFTGDGLTSYFVDAGNKCIRKVTVTGLCVTIASSLPGRFLDNPSLRYPPPVQMDIEGNLLIIDKGQIWILLLGSSSLLVTYSGTDAVLVTPNATDFSLTFSSGDLYIADGPRVHALYAPNDS